MKSIYSYALLGALAAVGVASAATTTTTPVGYVSLGDTTTGQPAVKAQTDVAISIPLSNAVEYTGTTSVAGSGSTLTVSGTPWTAGQWVSPTTPYMVSVSSGNENGLFGVVTANTTNTITITTAAGVVANVGLGDKFVITKAWTLGSFIATGTVPNGTQLLAYDGIANGTNLAASQVYAMTVNGWVGISGATGNQNAAVIYPGESFVLRTAATAVTSLVVTGTVPTWNHRTTIDKHLATTAQDNRISYFSPVGETLANASIPAVTGDQLLVFNNGAAGKNKAASAVIARTATGWVGISGVTGDQSGFLIGGGAGYVYRRTAAATAVVGNIDWKDAPSYQATL